ncbi:leucyl aminopeptidase family protein [Haloechinothrix halophila]|uniref:leucyl aminopeptidase family protein n=1 Tax=Haloechinothrix halophila TaxID=1069073 RepID=UPI0005545C19|nr:leucyl aminopeptidase family protein [Haloechinothrix halophila]
MVRTPVPSLPSTVPDVEIASSVRRGAPIALLTVPFDATVHGERTSVNGDSALSAYGTPLPESALPPGVVTGKAGEIHPLRGATRWLLGLGADQTDANNWRSAGAALVRAINADLAARDDAGATAPDTVQVELPGDVEPRCVTGFVLGVCLGGYRLTVTEQQQSPRLATVRLVVGDDRLAELTDVAGAARQLAEATSLARDLANTPSNVKNPDWLASTVSDVLADVVGLDVEVRDLGWLTANGFGGLLAVGGGSASEPRLIEINYQPKDATRTLLLVGKGITFDTGGISLKPSDGMHLMRTDMSGAAAVAGAMRAIAQRGPDIAVRALIPAAENHVSGSAYRPGDVVRHYGGKTTEIGNTDAEGRIVMADALAYGVERFAPDAVVDVATLTGAMKMALGLRTGGFFATTDELADVLSAAGERVGEAWWRMPLLAAHEDAVRGRLADVRQTPDGPGGITAALFLREFTGGLPWAHLDIAGPARADKTYNEVTPGGTGFAARTLVEFVAAYANA